MTTVLSAKVSVSRLGFSTLSPTQDSAFMSDSAGKLSVLVPVYNEERTISEILDRVLSLGSIVKEIVVVDDGSKDRTAEIVKAKAESEPKIRFHPMPKNQGKTAAIRQALLLATGDILIVQDADLEYDRRKFPR